MSTKAFLDTNFDDDEESETEFNPGVEQGSEDENDAAAPPRKAERASPPQTNGRSKTRDSPVDDLKDEDAEDEEDNGEDDEGEGEDLGDNDDDDEDEEDEDDEDAVTGRPKKRRRRGLNQFIEEEAEVDEDDDELEADEDDIAETGFIQEAHPDDDLGPDVEQDDRRHRELDRQRQLEQSLDAEAAAARLKERYGRRTANALAKGSFVPQNLLMPSVDDPRIWTIMCKPGKEREVVNMIMKKFIDRLRTGRPLKICSAFERGGPESSMAGRVFVEARQVIHVTEALKSIPNVFHSKMTLTPLAEMPDLLRVKKTESLKIGEYVRIKKQGLYGGDLGVVDDTEDNGIDVMVRLVPRLDYGLNDDDNKASVPSEKRKRNAFAPAQTPLNRPPPRLFNETEAKKKHGRFLNQNRGGALTGRSWVYKNEQYEDGFLIKSFRRTHLETKDVNPKLEETMRLAQKSADGADTVDLETLARSIKNTTADGTFQPGEDIEVFQGEQRGLIGKVEGVTSDILRLRVTQGELAGQVIEQPINGVRKRFKDGDHVKVIGASRYHGEVGMVIRIKGDKVTILTDTSMTEITVFSKDLREAAEAGGSDIKASMFDVRDLVQINATEVGIVLKADFEAVKILDENSSVISRLPSQLSMAENKKNAVATDRNGSEIRVGDTVKESGGENKTGVILHIHRAHLFLHDRTRIENAGLWTTRCMNVITIASKATVTGSGPDLTKMNPNLGGRNGASAMAAPPPRIGRDRLIGQMVHIRKGPYKMHKGIVKDTTAEGARVELQSKNKVINISKQDLSVVDKASGKTMDYNTFAHSRGPAFPIRSGTGPAEGSRVPGGFSGGRTPAISGDGGRTPAWGASSARTPAWNGAGMDSGKTPAWKPSSGSQTSYGGAGGMTQYGGAGNYGGSRTPAWSASAKTPYAGDHGFSSGGSGYDAFAAGSRTPYGGATSSRTPYQANNTAQTPAGRPYDAPTPGMSAPTPGGFDNLEGGYTAYGGSAPTPGAGFGAGPIDAPTPGMPALPGFAKGANKEELKYNRLNAAPTPAAYDAPTPAAGGPRYADDDDED